ncbi:MAG: VWA domain-containing protein [Siculibacillus sp.]|nr:VWA domain-containing protein [Siculibacillus sp.]
MSADEPRDRGALDHTGSTAPSGRSGADDIARFLAETSRKARRTAGGRLIFALDATMSRRATWEHASVLQAAMFEEAARVGGLEVQLVYYRGQGECRASRWFTEAADLARVMGGIDCRAGATAIGRVLSHVAAEARERPVAAMAFVGDACEEDEGLLEDLAGRAAMTGVACFMFQEGHDRRVARLFGEIARLTRGAHVPFDEGAADRLGALLRAVAAYATGGREALVALAARREGEGARLLLGRMDDPDAGGR